MIVLNRFTLDTNILIYAVDKSAGTRHVEADALMQREFAQGLNGDPAVFQRRAGVQ